MNRWIALVKADIRGLFYVLFPGRYRYASVLVANAVDHLQDDFYSRASFKDRVGILPEQKEALDILWWAQMQVPPGAAVHNG